MLFLIRTVSRLLAPHDNRTEHASTRTAVPLMSANNDPTLNWEIWLCNHQVKETQTSPVNGYQIQRDFPALNSIWRRNDHIFLAASSKVYTIPHTYINIQCLEIVISTATEYYPRLNSK